MISADQTIRESIQKIVNMSKPMKLDDVGIVQGYVFGYNKDYPDAIDVVSMDNSIVIRGVMLSSVYNNKLGVTIKPTLKSEVTVLLVGGVTGYVLCYSHLEDHSIVSRIKSYIGVAGVKQNSEDDDYDEHVENGKSSGTEYTETSAVTVVKQDSSESRISVEFNTILNQVGSNTFIKLTDGSIEQSVSGTTTKVSDGSYDVSATRISLGANANENAVLGIKLQTALNAFVDAVASITTTTSLGTMPIMNIPQVQALKAEIAKILSQTNFIE